MKNEKRTRWWNLRLFRSRRLSKNTDLCACEGGFTERFGKVGRQNVRPSVMEFAIAIEAAMQQKDDVRGVGWVEDQELCHLLAHLHLKLNKLVKTTDESGFQGERSLGNIAAIGCLLMLLFERSRRAP